MSMHLLGADTPFSQGLSTGIRLLLLEENSFVSEQDLVEALRVRVIGADDEIAREAGAIAWAITWLHPLALGFFVFGLCANHGWFDGHDSDDYVSRLLRVTPANHAREALALYSKYQANEADGGAAVIKGFGIESLQDFEEGVFGQA
jgi:hypothetical protein